MKILAIASAFPIFSCFVILSLLLMHNINRNTKKNKEINESFWEKERLANSTRRKSLDTVNYIVIPFNTLPMNTALDDIDISKYISIIEGLRDTPIANFTGISNTDLKLQYGAPNINHLSDCDEAFLTLARTLQDWAKRLHELGFDSEALTVLEFALDCRTDISSSYYLAASLYSKCGKTDKIEELKAIADTLNSAMKSSILRTLNEMYP